LFRFIFEIGFEIKETEFQSFPLSLSLGLQPNQPAGLLPSLFPSWPASSVLQAEQKATPPLARSCLHLRSPGRSPSKPAQQSRAGARSSVSLSNVRDPQLYPLTPCPTGQNHLPPPTVSDVDSSIAAVSASATPRLACAPRRSVLLIDQEHMKLTPTLSSPRRRCSYYDVVSTSVISLSSLYWPLPSPTSGRDPPGLRRRESEVA